MATLIGSAIVLANESWGHHMDWGGGWWIVMMIGMVLFWGLVVLGIVWLVRELSGRRGWPGRQPDPLELLDRRLAEGSISLEDYRERRAVLSGSREPEQGSGG
jgi:putative membrane protein